MPRRLSIRPLRALVCPRSSIPTRAASSRQRSLPRPCSTAAASSMDGRGAWRDNVFVERLWRSVKYECVYLKAYDSVSAARADTGRYLEWFNTHRAHSRLNGATPQQAYLNLSPKLEEAA